MNACGIGQLVMYLTEVPVTADRPYRCTDDAAFFRFTMNGIVAAAVNLTGMCDWARSDLTGMFDWARTTASPPTPSPPVVPPPIPIAVLVVVLVQACTKALTTLSVPAVMAMKYDELVMSGIMRGEEKGNERSKVK